MDPFKAPSKKEVAKNVFYLGEESAIQDLQSQGFNRESAYRIVQEAKREYQCL